MVCRYGLTAVLRGLLSESQDMKGSQDKLHELGTVFLERLCLDQSLVTRDLDRSVPQEIWEFERQHAAAGILHSLACELQHV